MLRTGRFFRWISTKSVGTKHFLAQLMQQSLLEFNYTQSHSAGKGNPIERSSSSHPRLSRVPGMDKMLSPLPAYSVCISPQDYQAHVLPIALIVHFGQIFIVPLFPFVSIPGLRYSSQPVVQHTWCKYPHSVCPLPFVSVQHAEMNKSGIF